MKVILIFVSTLDGKVVKWDGSMVKNWASMEDQAHFKNVFENSSLIVIGSKSFFADKPKVRDGQLMVVLTRNPEEYAQYEKPGMIEFGNMRPHEIVNHFDQLGYEQMTVVGGPHIATAFLKERLVHEIWLTIEPKIFGMGPGFVIQEKMDISLELINCEKVNNNGTLITRYKVLD